MSETKNGKKRIIITLVIILIVFAIGMISVFHPIKMLKVYSDLKSGEYQGLYVSQFPLDNYSMEDYQIFFGEKFYPVIVEDKTYLELCEVLAISYKCNVNDRFVGLSLNNLHESKLLSKLIEKRIDDKWTINFECVEASKVDAKYSDNLDSLIDLVSKYGERGNFGFSWTGWSEAVIINPYNFDDKGLKVNQTVECFENVFRLTQENVEARCEEFSRVIEFERSGGMSYPDFSDVEVVYLGDSILANSYPENSVSYLVSMYCNTKSIDLSVGGATCAKRPDGDTNCLSTQIESIPKELAESDKKILVVINIGLNDFFSGYSLNEDNEYSYGFSLSKNIERIREILPNADIFVMSPTYVHGFLGTKPENGSYELSEFRDEAKNVAERLGCEYIDNYNELGISDDNWSDLLKDDVHLNQQGRLLYARNLIKHMEVYFGDK